MELRQRDLQRPALQKVPWARHHIALKNIKVEVEKGFDRARLQGGAALPQLRRQTVFAAGLCIECDACVDICPMDCITFTERRREGDLRTRLKAPARTSAQDLYVATRLKTGRVMVKDEDVCLHCGLCAERCPTGAWDMQKFFLNDDARGAGAAATRPGQAAKGRGA